jgi:putative ABC transport system permease protein
VAAAGAAAGLAAAFLLTRLMSAVLYGVAATDPATYAGVASLLLVIAFGASDLPARRAARLDPVRALRAE